MSYGLKLKLFVNYFFNVFDLNFYILSRRETFMCVSKKKLNQTSCVNYLSERKNT